MLPGELGLVVKRLFTPGERMRRVRKAELKDGLRHEPALLGRHVVVRVEGDMEHQAILN